MSDTIGKKIHSRWQIDGVPLPLTKSRRLIYRKEERDWSPPINSMCARTSISGGSRFFGRVWFHSFSFKRSRDSNIWGAWRSNLECPSWGQQLSTTSFAPPACVPASANLRYFLDKWSISNKRDSARIGGRFLLAFIKGDLLLKANQNELPLADLLDRSPFLTPRAGFSCSLEERSKLDSTVKMDLMSFSTRGWVPAREDKVLMSTEWTWRIVGLRL